MTLTFDISEQYIEAYIDVLKNEQRSVVAFQ